MKIGVHIWKSNPYSFDLYRDSIVGCLSMMGVTPIPFSDGGARTLKVDIVWEPSLGGSRVPPGFLMRMRAPVVATVHGAGSFVMPYKELYSTTREMLLDQAIARFTMFRWQQFKRKVAHVIAVSDYGAAEITKVFGLSAGNITSIYHGVDHSLFHPQEESIVNSPPYMFLVSQYHPKKNVGRILEAYRNLPMTDKPPMIAVLPGFKGRACSDGISFIRNKINSQELAERYRNAIMFVFPSLHEAFGLPILEAMASGCPVITSNATGCIEIASDAALLVDPRSVSDITTAMKRLCDDAALRDDLRRRGIERARQFTWERSAREHLAVFLKVLERPAVQSQAQ